MTASVLGSYFTSQLSTQQQFSDVNQKVVKVTTTEEDHYEELSRRLDELKDGQKEILQELKKK